MLIEHFVTDRNHRELHCIIDSEYKSHTDVYVLEQEDYFVF